MITSLLLHSALAAPGVLNLAPFGVGVYAHDRPLRGLAYTLLQAGGIATLTTASVLAADAMEAQDIGEVQRMQTFASIGVTVAIGGYAVSVFDGVRLHELEVEKARQNVRAWDQARWMAEGER